MKYLKKYEQIKITLPDLLSMKAGNTMAYYKRKYKEDDIVGYDKYVDSPSIIVEIVRANTKSNYKPYFVSELKPPHHTHILQEDDLIDLTPEQQEEVELYKNMKKYNL